MRITAGTGMVEKLLRKAISPQIQRPPQIRPDDPKAELRTESGCRMLVPLKSNGGARRERQRNERQRNGDFCQTKPSSRDGQRFAIKNRLFAAYFSHNVSYFQYAAASLKPGRERRRRTGPVLRPGARPAPGCHAGADRNCPPRSSRSGNRASACKTGCARACSGD